MNKKRLYLFFGILLAISTVFAGTVTIENTTELHATNLTFKINDTITFESPVQISNNGYAIFGTQNFSVNQTTGHINITILSHTNLSATTTSQTNFWFFLEGQNENITIMVDNVSGTTKSVVETYSTGTTFRTISSSYADGSWFNLNATSNGTYIKINYYTPASTTTTTVASSSSNSGSSTESTTGAATKIWVTLNPGTPVSWILGKTNIAFTQMDVTVKNQVRTVKLTVNDLSTKPSSVEAVSGKVYQYLDITPQNIVNTDIESVKIKFRVEKAWMNNNNIDESNIVLNRYSDGRWSELATTRISDDTMYVYYEAETPGFSYFAVSSKESVVQEVTTTTVIESVVCGNGVCETGEDCGSCLEDCPCAEGYVCHDNVCGQETVMAEKKFPLKLVTIGVLILVTLAVIFWLVQSLKEEQKPKSDELVKSKPDKSKK